MTATSPSLTEFLLARIDEAEAMLSPAVDHVEYMGRRMIDAREFIRADAEAKRRVVALYRGATGANHSQRRGEHETAKAALRALALPYAGHPDYRDEWRP